VTEKIQIKQVEWFDSRFYKVDLLNNGIPETRWMPSVTSKLGIIDKPFLAEWRGSIGNREADTRMFESQQRGSRIHDAFNRLVNGQGVAYNPWNHPNYLADELEALKLKFGGLAVLNYQDEYFQVYKLKKWLDLVKPKILHAEKTVYSLLHNDAGTLDLACYIEGGNYFVNGSKVVFIPSGNYIVDLKTGNNLSDEANLQTACYLKCAEEMGLGKFNGTIILFTGSKNRGGIEGLGTHLRLMPEVEQDYKYYRLASELWMMKHKDDHPKVMELPSLLTLKGE
jgi:hypothetical protein